MKKIILGATAVLMLASCLDRNFGISDPTLSALSESIEVEATAPDMEFPVDTVLIRSNRSWTCKIVESDGSVCTWAEALTPEFENPSGFLETVVQIVKFQNNEVNTVRNAKLVFSSHEGTLEIPVRQNALQYQLALGGSSSLEVSCAGGIVEIPVICNTDWTASIKEGSTATAAIATPNMHKNDTLIVNFAENEEDFAKTATVVISAEDCENLEVVITQGKSMPSITINIEKSKTNYADTETSGIIYFKANANWTASAQGNFGNFKFINATGTRNDASVEFTFTKKPVLGDIHQTITLTLDNHPEVQQTIELTQTGNMIIDILFDINNMADWEPADASTPELPTKTRQYVMLGNYTYLPQGITLGFHSTGTGLGFYNDTGFCLDPTGKTTGWIVIPCPAEGTIKELDFKITNSSNKKVTILKKVNEDGTYSDDDVLMSTITLKNANAGIGTSRIWTVAPAKGESVIIHATKQKNAMIDSITAVIE